MRAYKPSLVLFAFGVALLGGRAQGQSSQAVPVPVLEALGIEAATLQQLQLPVHLLAAVAVPITLGGVATELVLYPHSIRSADFHVLVQLGDGSLQEVAAPAERTVRGFVRDWPSSVVSGALQDGRLTALAWSPVDERVWDILPYDAFVTGGDPTLHVVYDARASLGTAIPCSVPDAQVGLHEGIPTVQAAGTSGVGAPPAVCEIACDAQYQYYLTFGGADPVAATVADIESIIASTSAIYETEVLIEYELTTIVVRTAEPDPYTLQATGRVLIDQMEAWWNNNHCSIGRDVAQLFTTNGPQSFKGYANGNSVCNLAKAYSYVRSKFTSNFTHRVALSAHELGHNWSAGHCGCAQPTCGIMCGTLDNGNYTWFGDGEVAEILEKKATVTCLDTSTTPVPIIGSVVPEDVQTLAGTEVEITGEQFTTATTVEVGDLVLVPPQFTVFNHKKIVFAAPLLTEYSAFALGMKRVVVETPCGTSNAAALYYVEADPPILLAQAEAQNDADIVWEYGAGAGHYPFLIVSLSADVETIPGGLQVLSEVLLGYLGEQLDDAGLGGVRGHIPAGTFSLGTILYSQVLTSPDGKFVTAVSAIEQTEVVR